MKRTVKIILQALTSTALFGAIAVGADESTAWNRLDVVATAYCPCDKCCGKFADGVTAAGRDASTRGVAVDRALIPLGSKVMIPGYGMVTADDVGSAITEQRIDVRFPSHETALAWGRQKLMIYYKTP